MSISPPAPASTASGWPASRRSDDGIWTATVGEAKLRWSGGGEAEVAEISGRRKALRMGLDLEPGESRDFVLELSATGLDDVAFGRAAVGGDDGVVAASGCRASSGRSARATRGTPTR